MTPPEINSSVTISQMVDRSALVIAHPGHELCIYGWLETVRPWVFVLTDGSGRNGRSRLPSTSKILAQVGAEAGSLYGRFSDRQIYTALLQKDADLFIQLATELAAELLAHEIDHVVGDASEGYNPTHDVCRLLINAAVTIAAQVRCQPIQNWEFLLFDRQDSCLQEPHRSVLALELPESTFARKLATAQAYPELRGEVDAALKGKILPAMKAFPKLMPKVQKILNFSGEAAYRIECLRLVDAAETHAPISPFYEQYGKLLVAAGIYKHAICYQTHLLPIETAFQHFLAQPDCSLSIAKPNS